MKIGMLTSGGDCQGLNSALRDNKVVPVPLSEVAGKLKTVSPDCEEVLSAKAMGISMGV